LPKKRVSGTFVKKKFVKYSNTLNMNQINEASDDSLEASKKGLNEIHHM
jgi:hypothetical protein